MMRVQTDIDRGVVRKSVLFMHSFVTELLLDQLRPLPSKVL